MKQSTDDLSPERREIIEYLRREKLASPSDMREDLGRTGDSIRMMLHRMLDDGQVVRPMRGYYTLPEIAGDLGVSEVGEKESSGEKEPVENPLSGSPSGSEESIEESIEEGKRRRGIAGVAKTMIDAARASGDDNTTTFVARKHPWWPMRTDVWARLRWWVAERLARVIVWLIPREELPNKDAIYEDD